MKTKRLLRAALTVGLGLATISGAPIAEAEGKGSKREASTPASTDQPPMTKTPIVLIPEGIAWGMSLKQVAAVVDKLIDKTYKDDKVLPGSREEARLLTTIAEEKAAFRRSLFRFDRQGATDMTPLRNEYTVGNKEARMTLDLEQPKEKDKKKGKLLIHFFFIQDKLWKVIDERVLGEGPAKDDVDYFSEAVMKLAATFGVGRVLPPDYDKGRNAVEVDWKDASTHMRAIQRSDTAMALALEDNLTLSNLASLRTNKPQEEEGIDPAVAAAMRKNDESAPPPPPPPPNDKKK